MRIVIHARSGELQVRRDDLRKVVDRLIKGAPKGVDQQIDQRPRKLDYPALQGAVDRAQHNVDRARRTMLRRFAQVLGD